MKKAFVFLFINLFFLQLYANEKIVTWDNKEIIGGNLIFNGKEFTLDSSTIPLDEVSYIIFNQEQQKIDYHESVLENVSPEELLERAKILEKSYKDSSLLILNDEGIEMLNKDGSRYTRSRYSVKIMNEKEISNYNILSFYYQKGSYESKIIMARSITPEGAVSYLNPSDISMTIPTQNLDFFSQRKEEKLIKAIIPNVRVGSIVDFEFEILEPSPEDKNQFYASWFFGGDKPVYRSRLYVTVPSEKEFYYALRNCNITPSVNEKDGYKTYTFESGISGPIINEPYSLPTGELYPSVFGSLFKDQTYLSGWLSKFIKERMVANDEMKAIVDRIIKDSQAKTEEEKITVLYRYVQEQIKYRSIKTSLSSGFSGHPAAETLKNQYGDCIDKSILFATLLNIAGIEAYPVIVNTNDNPSVMYDKIGTITGNHAINEIHLKEKKDKIIYLDTTSTTYRYPSFRYDDQGIYAWNPILNTVNYIAPLDASYNTQVYKKEINLLYDGSGDIKNHIVYSGDIEAGIREYFAKISEGELKSTIRSIITRDYPGAILVASNNGDPADFNNNMFLDLHYKADNIAKVSNKYLILNIPVVYDFDFISLKERKYPLKFPTTEGKTNYISIIIPNGFKIGGLPDKIKIDNPFFIYEAEYKIENNKIIFKDIFQRNACLIQPEDYKILKDDLVKVDYFIRTPIIFIKK
jgi:hypothetical protein